MDIHNDPVQCLTWSMNGMKLFSGDTRGCVGCTEVDFYEVCSDVKFLLSIKIFQPLIT